MASLANPLLLTLATLVLSVGSFEDTFGRNATKRMLGIPCVRKLDTCPSHSRCSALAPVACNETRSCMCLRGFVAIGNMCRREAPAIGSTCYRPKDGAQYYCSVENSMCLGGNCQCNQGYRQFQDKCIPESSPEGSPCVFDSDCSGKWSCQNGYCRCNGKNRLDQTRCVAKTLGDRCVGDYDCADVDYSYCNYDNICRCRKGYVELNHEIILGQNQYSLKKICARRNALNRRGEVCDPDHRNGIACYYGLSCLQCQGQTRFEPVCAVLNVPVAPFRTRCPTTTTTTTTSFPEETTRFDFEETESTTISTTTEKSVISGCSIIDVYMPLLLTLLAVLPALKF